MPVQYKHTSPSEEAASDAAETQLYRLPSDSKHPLSQSPSILRANAALRGRPARAASVELREIYARQSTQPLTFSPSPPITPPASAVHRHSSILRYDPSTLTTSTPTPATEKASMFASPTPLYSPTEKSIYSVETRNSDKTKVSEEQEDEDELLFKPSIKLIFSLSTRRDKWTILWPAVLASSLAGFIIPVMTVLMGAAFNVFVKYQVAAFESFPDLPPPSAGNTLKSEMVKIALQFIGLGTASFLINTLANFLWVWTGEKVALRLKMETYRGISSRPIEWFDLGMGKSKAGGEQEANSSESGNQSSGGLMGRFASEIDDVRIAAQSLGVIATSAVSAIACLCFAFAKSYQLTFLILASVPCIIILTGVTEKLVEPHLTTDRETLAKAAGKIERVASAITTVKAFNAQSFEHGGFAKMIEVVRTTYIKICWLWGIRSGGTHIILMTIFVAGYWFGNHLVNQGHSTAGNINQVFWATILASSSVQTVVPALVLIEKGKVAMAALLTTIHEEVPSQASDERRGSDQTAVSPVISKFPQSPRALRKIIPTNFTGEMALRNVTFHYPSRPHPAAPALRDVSLFLPAGETTYIVGSSGSGKSTVGALLMGMYQPERGTVEADEQGINWLDDEWLRSHIAMVSQGASVVLEGTVHENVAIGVIGKPGKIDPSTVTREEVIRACQAALVHDFIKDLPEGYDTQLSGEKGASLSGGQRQRLAIARAYIRDPTILVLDESTSALDATSRLLVHEAVKVYRQNKTTIIITHDLSPITSKDFVYVLKDGEVVEQGFREQLEADQDGWFTTLTSLQKNQNTVIEEGVDTFEEYGRTSPSGLTRATALPVADVRRSAWLAPNGLLGAPPSYFSSQAAEFQDVRRRSRLLSTTPQFNMDKELPIPSYLDLQFESKRHQAGLSMLAIEHSAHTAARRRPGLPRIHPSEHEGKEDVELEMESEEKSVQPAGFFEVLRKAWPHLPQKPQFFLGVLLCVASGVATPIFSSFMAKLLGSLGKPNPDPTSLVKVSIILLCICTGDGIAQCFKYVLMQTVSINWISKLQTEGFTRMLSRDRTWFDQPEHASTLLVNRIVHDGTDSRQLFGYIVGNVITASSMIGLGIVWAMVAGWQLTLVGVGMAPLFVILTAFQTFMLGKYEVLNKAEREDVNKKFHVTVSNVKAIRSMSIESVFSTRFEAAAEAAYRGGLKSAIYVGFGAAIGPCLSNIAQALMFLVGATLIANGTYRYEQMLQVFTLIIFSITFGAQILSYVPQIAKAKEAAHGLVKLHALSDDSSESSGNFKFPIRGHLKFDRVSFEYPSRPGVPVLQNMSLDIYPGECVAIVGASGSGKSTVAALLQRLYEPESGKIYLDAQPLDGIDTKFLRNHTAVISQHPALFDMTVADNIAYGSPDASLDNVVASAKAANVHDFILTLPQGYKTHLGENAGLISGGQAQRLQIARALLRPREILIGDEITSALDAENQEAVMSTIMNVKSGRTTILVTHKLAVMKMCDRVLVCSNGRIVQEGTFAALMADSKGHFAALASGGEWQM